MSSSTDNVSDVIIVPRGASSQTVRRLCKEVIEANFKNHTYQILNYDNIWMQCRTHDVFVDRGGCIRVFADILPPKSPTDSSKRTPDVLYPGIENVD